MDTLILSTVGTLLGVGILVGGVYVGTILKNAYDDFMAVTRNQQQSLDIAMRKMDEVAVKIRNLQQEVQRLNGIKVRLGNENDKLFPDREPSEF